MLFFLQGKTKKKLFFIPEWLGIGAVLQNTHVTAEDLQMLDQELGEDELEIESEIQAMEEQNRLDADHAGNQNDRRQKEASLNVPVVVVVVVVVVVAGVVVVVMVVVEIECKLMDTEEQDRFDTNQAARTTGGR